jgi:cilia- and flagella-associated protein 57
MKDGGLKLGLPFSQKLNLNRHWTQHCWLDEKKLIGCTIDGEMYYIENDVQNKMFDIKKEFENAFNTDETQSHVVAIQRFNKGFFIGSQNGEMAMWVRSEENNSSSGKDPYDFVRKWQPPATKRQRVLGLSVSGNDDYLAVSLQNNNIGLVTIKSIGLNEDTSKEIKFELVCKGFHSEKISGVDVAVQRPILVTCSRDDSTVRLWNYKTGQCELAREYYVMEDNALRAQSKPLVAAAIHPSGYQLAISFIDKIWVHHILHDELRKLKSLEIKNATLLKYSRGGQYFFALEK